MIALALATLLPLVPVTSETCIGCHRDAATAAHPYSVRYVARRDGESQIRPSSMPSGFGGTIAADFLVNGRVECATCHATHEQETDSKFRLRVSGDNPTPLCEACHVLEH